MSSRAKAPDENNCLNCGRLMPVEREREWLCRGTGVCSGCARARIAKQESRGAGRQYIENWRLVLDSCRSLAVGLRPR